MPRIISVGHYDRGQRDAARGGLPPTPWSGSSSTTRYPKSPASDAASHPGGANIWPISTPFPPRRMRRYRPRPRVSAPGHGGALWQCSIHSPGLSASNSTDRLCPGRTIAVSLRGAVIGRVEGVPVQVHRVPHGGGVDEVDAYPLAGADRFDVPVVVPAAVEAPVVAHNPAGALQPEGTVNRPAGQALRLGRLELAVGHDPSVEFARAYPGRRGCAGSGADHPGPPSLGLVFVVLGFAVEVSGIASDASIRHARG